MKGRKHYNALTFEDINQRNLEKDYMPYPSDISPELWNQYSKEYRSMLDLTCGVVAHLIKTMKEGSSEIKLLDILPLSGDFLLGLLRRLPLTVSAFEVSRSNIVHIREKLLRYGFSQRRVDFLINENELDIPVDDNRFDFVTCFHRVDLKIRNSIILDEIKRVLKPSGIALLSFLNSWSLFNMRLKMKLLSNRTIFSPVSPLFFMCKLKRRDFRIVKVFGLRHPSYFLRCKVAEICYYLGRADIYYNLFDKAYLNYLCSGIEKWFADILFVIVQG